MKRLILILACLCLSALPVVAGAQTDYVLNLTNTSTVATNGAAVTTNTSEVLDGYIDAVYIDLSGYASPTCSVTLATSGALPSRTILAATSVTADGWYYPRAASVNTAGSAISGASTRIPLVRDAIKTWGSAANSTGIFVRVWVLKTDMP